MKKQTFKTFAMLLFMAVTVFTFASCNKDDDDSTNDVNNTIVLADTEWSWSDIDADEIIDLSVEFNGPALADLTTTDMSSGIMQVYIYMGTYSVSGSQGTLHLKDDETDTPFNVNFSVSGNTMTLTYRGVTYNLTKESDK